MNRLAFSRSFRTPISLLSLMATTPPSLLHAIVPPSHKRRANAYHTIQPPRFIATRSPIEVHASLYAPLLSRALTCQHWPPRVAPLSLRARHRACHVISYFTHVRRKVLPPGCHFSLDAIIICWLKAFHYYDRVEIRTRYNIFDALFYITILMMIIYYVSILFVRCPPSFRLLSC